MDAVRGDGPLTKDLMRTEALHYRILLFWRLSY